MTKLARTLAPVALSLALVLPARGQSGHDMKGMDHGSMKGMDHGAVKGTDHGTAAAGERHGRKIREAKVEGHVLEYYLIDAAEMMKGKPMEGHDMSRMKSHHLMLFIAGPGGPVTGAKVGFKVEGPSGEQKAMAMAMEGGYGADVDLKAPGVHEIKTKAVAGETTLIDAFPYEVR